MFDGEFCFPFDYAEAVEGPLRTQVSLCFSIEVVALEVKMSLVL